MTTRILVSAGGTGGGIYPALAVIEALRRRSEQIRVDYVGGVGGMEDKLVPRSLVDGYHSLPSGPVHGVPIPQMVASLAKITVGTLRGLALIQRLKPDALFMTGGWATLPISAAAWLSRVPILIFLPDIEPALTIRVTSRLARTILVSAQESARYFSKPVVETGYPLRAEVLNATREAGIAAFGLDPTRRTLLITGGSRGAKTINTAIADCASQLIESGLQLLHISGETDHSAAQARRDSLPVEIQAHYHLYPYLHNQMGSAYACADLVLSRAGASVIGEYPYFGLPSILVPYPYAWRYQKVNADYLTSRGAAIRLNDEDMARDLLSTIQAVLNDPSRLEGMRQAALHLRRADAADRIAEAIIN